MHKDISNKLKGKKTNKDKNKTSTDLIFRFVLYENQRWWLGLDWTTNLFLNERPAWSDEYNVQTSPKDSFSLPPPSTTITETPEDPNVLIKKTMEWKWDDNDWWIDYDGDVDKEGWEYADNRWKGFSSKGGFRKYTRRRKWVRAARLVETKEKIEKNNNDQVPSGTNDDDHEQIMKTSENFETQEEIPSLSSNSSNDKKPLPLIPRKSDGKFDLEAIPKSSNGNSI